MAPQSPLGKRVAHGIPTCPDPSRSIRGVRRSGKNVAPKSVTPARANTRSPSLSLRAASSAGCARSLQTVEDQIEPELELACAVTAWRGDVLAGVLSEVRVVGGRQFREEPLHDVCQVTIAEFLRADRMTELPECEPEDVAVECVIRVIRQVGRKAGFAQSSQ